MVVGGEEDIWFANLTSPAQIPTKSYRRLSVFLLMKTARADCICPHRRLISCPDLAEIDYFILLIVGNPSF